MKKEYPLETVDADEILEAIKEVFPGSVPLWEERSGVLRFQILQVPSGRRVHTFSLWVNWPGRWHCDWSIESPTDSCFSAGRPGTLQEALSELNFWIEDFGVALRGLSDGNHTKNC